MAKVFAPFLSIGAKGTVGKTLTASTWKGREYMKQRFVPHNPKTAKQNARRQTMIDGVSKWRFNGGFISADEKILWESYGKKHQVSGFNRFMSAYMKENYVKGAEAVVSPQVVPKPK